MIIPTWGYWAGGLSIAALGAYKLLSPSKPVDSQAANTAPVDTGANYDMSGVAAQPLFIPAGGGGGGGGVSDNTDQGRQINQPVSTDLSQNVDYQIALLNQQVQLANISSNEKLTSSAIAATVVPNTPPVSSSTNELRGNSIKAGADFISQTLAQVPKIGQSAAEMAIYNAAAANNYSKSEVAAAYSAAGVQGVSVATIDKWLADHDLTLK